MGCSRNGVGFVSVVQDGDGDEGYFPSDVILFRGKTYGAAATTTIIDALTCSY